MQVTGFNHLTINVTNLPVSLAFYRDILGLRVVHLGSKDAYLEWGSAWVCLIERSGLDRPAGKSLGPDHIAFHIEEEHFGGAVDKLRTNGVTIVREPVKRGAGWSVNFLDPDGTELELHTSTLRERMKVWK